MPSRAVTTNRFGPRGTGSADGGEPGRVATHSRGDDGIVAFESAREHLIAHNKAFENGNNDCEDRSTGTYNPPALVANRWVKDLGRTENRPGLCKQAARSN